LREKFARKGAKAQKKSVPSVAKKNDQQKQNTAFLFLAPLVPVCYRGTGIAYYFLCLVY